MSAAEQAFRKVPLVLTPEHLQPTTTNSHIDPIPDTDAYCDSNVDANSDPDSNSNVYADAMHGQVYTDAEAASDASAAAQSINYLRMITS